MTADRPTWDWSPQYCSDGIFVPAPAELVFDALLNIADWNRWWETMRFERPGQGPMCVGDHIVFDGGATRWTVEVTEIEPPKRIAFRYFDGALLGPTEWRVTPQPDGCRAEYVYLGVMAVQDRAAATFGRFGTRLHTAVMQADALSGLVRAVTGQPLDEAWRQSVRDAVAKHVRELVEFDHATFADDHRTAG